MATGNYEMSNPDWTQAPVGATHYDTYADCFCDINGWWRMDRYQLLKNQNEWGTSRYTPRPVKATVPDWTQSPKGATRYDHNAGVFCNAAGWWDDSGKYWASPQNLGMEHNRYTQPPIDAEKWVDGYPPVGTECEVLDSVNGKWNGVQITGVSRDHLVVIFNDEEVLLNKNCRFRSICNQAQRERYNLLSSTIEKYREWLKNPASTAELILIAEFASYLYDAGIHVAELEYILCTQEGDPLDAKRTYTLHVPEKKFSRDAPFRCK
jgi:hypothetical protein